jgi:hypothetical protein
VPGYEFSGWTGVSHRRRRRARSSNACRRDREDRCQRRTPGSGSPASGSDAGILSPQEFADFIRSEHTKLGKLIRDAGVRARR